jgi:hypothetical protein
MTTDQNPIPVTPKRADSLADAMDLCMHIGDGSNSEGTVQFDISSTIGMGGMILILDVAQEGKPKVRETVNLQDLVQAWVNQIVSTTAPVDAEPPSELDAAVAEYHRLDREEAAAIQLGIDLGIDRADAAARARELGWRG